LWPITSLSHVADVASNTFSDMTDLLNRIFYYIASTIYLSTKRCKALEDAGGREYLIDSDYWYLVCFKE
jgi:hypothetical protein